jgi:hypothetical protein
VSLRHVKGVLFSDYVRMIRGNKHVDWSQPISDDDYGWVKTKIDPAGWYPMPVFEQLGNAILATVAGGSLDAVRMWGRFSVDQLSAAQPQLVSAGDPIETMRRFQVLRSTYFDFEALTVLSAASGEAQVEIRYHMGPVAEEAASFQTLGFFERLLEVAGATDVFAHFVERSWAGQPRTLLDLRWRDESERPAAPAANPVVGRLRKG